MQDIEEIQKENEQLKEENRILKKELDDASKLLDGLTIPELLELVKQYGGLEEQVERIKNMVLILDNKDYWERHMLTDFFHDVKKELFPTERKGDEK